MKPTPLTDEEIDAAYEAAVRSLKRSRAQVRGQMLMPSDSFDWHFARVVEAAVNAKWEALQAKPVCNHCNGSGRMVRDPEIGTDQECFVCEGSGVCHD